MRKIFTSMRSLLCVVALLCSCLTAYAGTKEIIHFSVTRPATMPVNQLTDCGFNNLYVVLKFGYTSEEDLAKALESGEVVFHARQGTTDNWYTTATSGAYGHWFNTNGWAQKSSASKAVVMGRYDNGAYYVAHSPAKIKSGTVTFAQAFIRATDTLMYEVQVTIDADAEVASVTTDQPSKDDTFLHRKDYTDDWTVRPRTRRNEQPYLYDNYVQVWAGEQISLGAELTDEDKAKGYTLECQWKNSAGKALTKFIKEDFVIEDAEYSDGGYYQVRARIKTAEGSFVSAKEYYYFVDVQTEAVGTPWDWTEHTPKFSYYFRDEYPDLETPTKSHKFYKKDGSAANMVEGEWWTAYWGDGLNSVCGTADDNWGNCFENMVKKFDEDFAYIRDNMGWPPDKSPKKGYKSFIYVFGSGLQNDNTDPEEMGGYQGYTNADGDGWPCVWASYYPISRFRDDADQKWSDGDYQREAMIHEGIHAILADMPGARNAAWFHEGGNTWLQAAMSTERYGSTGDPGFLDACQFIAPFMPIECYSGWLQDGSFGGPSAEGVNMFEGSQQICTWRNLLGGTQYGNGFPTVLGEIVGKGAIPWIWRYCPDRVLEGIADSIGEEPMRNLIMQYRSRQCLYDFGIPSNGYRKVMNNNMGATIGAEWSPKWIDCEPYKLTPYQAMTRNTKDRWLAPEQITTPGWSGANFIPIHVEGDVVKVEFRPEDLNMRAQLCYRTKDGKAYYSQPALCGTLTIDITDEPANGVIFCVVANTDFRYNDTSYDYYGESLRKHHFDYRVKLGEGALAVADRYQRWYFHEQTIIDEAFETGIKDVEYGDTEVQRESNKIRILTSVIRGGETVQLDLNGINADDVKVRIVGLSGIIIESGNLNSEGNFTMPEVYPGLYFITLSHGSQREVFKCIVK